MTEPLAVETHALRKEYGSTIAVEDLDLAVGRGEVFGFLGPNGAGKTTVVKMLLGLVRPTAGAANVLGQPAGDWRSRARVGFLPEHFRFQEWLTASEFLQVHGRLYGMAAAARKQRAAELLGQLDLERHADKQLKDFSKGMLQRVGLAQALINDPELVFLDEPTSGLDPIGRRLVRDVVQQLRARGATVFLNSHLLSEVEITCDRVAFVRRGRIIRSGSLADLLAAGTEVTLKLNGRWSEVAEDLGRVGWQATAAGDGVLVRLQAYEQVPDLVAWLVDRGVRLYGVVPKHESLEELFLRLMEGEEAG